MKPIKTNLIKGKLKTSTKLLLVGLGLVASATCLHIVRLESFFFFEQPDYVVFSQSDPTTRVHELNERDFDTLELEGFWLVKLRQGEDHAIELKASQETRRRLNIEREGRTLRIAQEFFPLGDEQVELTVTMPRLKALRVRGGNEIELVSFKQKGGRIDARGMNQITGADCDYRTLEISGVGLFGIDLSGCRLHNARLDLQGFGETILTMTGGDITGQIGEGVDLVHKGPVRRKDVVVARPGEPDTENAPGPDEPETDRE